MYTTNAPSCQPRQKNTHKAKKGKARHQYHNSCSRPPSANERPHGAPSPPPTSNQPGAPRCKNNPTSVSKKKGAKGNKPNKNKNNQHKAEPTSSAGSMGGFQSLVCTLRMSRLALRVGRGKASSLSKRPGRRSAGSRLSGRLVAPTTMT